MIALVDAGIGNLRSVERALRAAAPNRTLDVVITGDPDEVRRADRVIMPGQGAFRDCATALGRGLGEALIDAIVRGVPYLGICLGLQVLFASSDEAPGCAGLGWFAGTVKRFGDDLQSAQGEPLKIPHMGWNVAETAHAEARAIVGDDPWFYFVHSYVVVPDDLTIVATRTDHGGPFVSGVHRDNVLAVQFHPEKSQQAGLALLTRWLAT